MKMRTKICIFLAGVFLGISYAFAKSTYGDTLKVAFLETPYDEIPLNLSLFSEYKKAYLAGAEVAEYVAKRSHINIEFKPFFYADGPLDIINEIPKIKQWDADLVIGPSSSDQFVLLKNYLSDRIVLSAYASGEMLKTLPKNFYSIFLPDETVMKLLANYIYKKFPEKNIYIIAQADSKQCVGVSQLFIKNYNKLSPQSKITEAKIILDDIDLVDSKKLMSGHENDVIIIFNFTFYSYNLLVKHITSDIPNKHMIFFSDEDNWGNEVPNVYNKKEMNYESYRIGPLLTDNKNTKYQTFAKAYFELYHDKPEDAVSYMVYITIMSAVEALNKYPHQNKNEKMRQKLFYSYLTALKNDPAWFKVKDYGVYLLTPNGEALDEKTNLN